MLIVWVSVILWLLNVCKCPVYSMCCDRVTGVLEKRVSGEVNEGGGC